jgi:hypothetical protein
MKYRLFALAMFALLVFSGAWSHPAQARCDASVQQGGSGIIPA